MAGTAQSQLWRAPSWSLPSGSRVLFWAAVPLGSALLAHSFFQALASLPESPAWLFLAAATIAASLFPVPLPSPGRKSGRGQVTASDIFVFAAMLLFSAHVAVVVAALDVFVGGFRKARPVQILFNVAQTSVVAFAVSHIFYNLHHYPPLQASQVEDLPVFYLKLMFSTALYFAATTAAVARAMSLKSSSPFLEVWRENFLFNSLISITAISGGAVVFLSFERAQFIAVALALPLILVLLCVYRMNYGRAESLHKAMTLAHFDPLTGLPNRQLFHDRLQTHLAQARREGLGLALLFLDLDNFKQVNDTLGHEAGDRVLQVAAERMQGCLRASDTVARLAGDEFTIILTGLQREDAGQVARVAEKILQSFQEPVLPAGDAPSVTSSIGVSLFPADGEEPEMLLQRADQAMYQAKKSGRNGYRFFGKEV